MPIDIPKIVSYFSIHLNFKVIRSDFYCTNKMHDTLKFVGIAFTIIVSFSINYLLHEKIVKQDYFDETGKLEKFSCFQVLVGFLCICYFIIGLVCHNIFKENHDTTRQRWYFISSVCYMTATLCGNYALKWISYPAQVIAKCAKPIPTLILTTVIGKRRYKIRKYFFIVIIVLGIILFMYNKDKANKKMENSVWYGEILLITALLLDGIRSGFEEKIRHESAPAPFSMMLAINGYSSVILIVSVFVNGEIFEFIEFVTKYPKVLQYLAIMAIVSGFGQVFVFTMLSHFGPLPLSVVATTRKFFTVLFSVMVYGHVVLYYQWIGVAMVFGGLFADIFFGDNKTNKKRRDELHGKGEVNDIEICDEINKK
uniref:CSON001637 protein n=1 Tax=Culicoides sonorensis TaxID=179676 RepID=A0A336LR33_CULSO